MNEQLIDEFIAAYPRSKKPLNTWRDLMIAQNFKNIAELRVILPTADAVGSCTAFNIGGNKWRLITKINYGESIISINEVLTHAEYDQEKWKKNCGK